MRTCGVGGSGCLLNVPSLTLSLRLSQLNGRKKGVHMGAGWLRKDVYNRRTAPRVRAIHSIQLRISYQFLLRQTSILHNELPLDCPGHPRGE